MLLDIGRQEKEKTMQSLIERLERMSPANIMRTQADLMNSMMEIQNKKPLPLMVI